MNELPCEAHFGDYLESFEMRREYIKDFGYIYLTEVFMKEMVKVCEKYNLTNFIELGAGTGSFTKVLNDYGIKGKGLTLSLNNKDDNWGMSPSPIYDYCLDNALLILDDMRESNIKLPELVISSWIPYRGGDEVQAFFANNDLPEYYLVIGEGYGGCTASDNFFDFLDENFKEIYTFEKYKSFPAIYDQAILYKRG
jgi:hypothetical protein